MKSQDSIDRVVVILSGLFCCLVSGTIQAETQSFTASVRFIAPITFSDVADPDMGTFESGEPGRNFVLGTDGSISGADADAYVGGASPGRVVIHGSSGQRIDIVARNLVDDGGIAISNIICNYGGTGDTDCASGIAAASQPGEDGTPLLIGMDVNTTASHMDGDSAAPAFDIVVTYN